jgi:hypothetical protein
MSIQTYPLSSLSIKEQIAIQFMSSMSAALISSGRDLKEGWRYEDMAHEALSMSDALLREFEKNKATAREAGNP